MSRVCLGDIAVEHKETCKGNKEGYPVVGLEHLTPGEITLAEWDESGDNTFTKVFRKGNVLFGRRRAYLKKAAVAPFDGVCSGDITVIEARQDKVLPELLPFIIQNDALFAFAVEKSAGSLSPRVKWEHLKNFEFELPEMSKQRTLAEALWSIDATKKAYQKLIKQTDELVKSQFMEMFGKTTLIALGEVANISAGQSSPYDEEFSPTGTPFIKAGNLEDLKLRRYGEEKCNLVQEDVVRSRKLKIHGAGTVLIAKSGMSCLSGHVYALKKPAYVVSHLACIEPREGKSTTEFLRWYFITYGIKGLIKDPSYPSIQLGQLEELLIPGAAIDLQNVFTAFATQTDKSKLFLQSAIELILPQGCRRMRTPLE